MIGAIAGDMIGSIYEHHPIKTVDFPLFAPQCRFSIAEAYYGGVPAEIRDWAMALLDERLRAIALAFKQRFEQSRH